jgi:hypothetical protein
MWHGARTPILAEVIAKKNGANDDAKGNLTLFGDHEGFLGGN